MVTSSRLTQIAACALFAMLPFVGQAQSISITLEQAPNAVEALLTQGKFDAARDVALAAVK